MQKSAGWGWRVALCGVDGRREVDKAEVDVEGGGQTHHEGPRIQQLEAEELQS